MQNKLVLNILQQFSSLYNNLNISRALHHIYECNNMTHSRVSQLEVHFPAEFHSNPNQTLLNKLIKVFRINRKLQAGQFLSRATSRARASDIQNLKCVKNVKHLNFHIQTPARLTAGVIKLNNF